jgi:hypothetical protein
MSDFCIPIAAMPLSKRTGEFLSKIILETRMWRAPFDTAPYTDLPQTNQSKSDWHGSPESQRDSGPKPRVGESASLPWVSHANDLFFNRNAVAARVARGRK